jgi:hypothetical protein
MALGDRGQTKRERQQAIPLLIQTSPVTFFVAVRTTVHNNPLFTALIGNDVWNDMTRAVYARGCGLSFAAARRVSYAAAKELLCLSRFG